MKKTFTFTTIFFMVALLLSSCSTSDKVATNNLIQKRKYNKGFFMDPVKQTSSKKDNLTKEKAGETNFPSLEEVQHLEETRASALPDVKPAEKTIIPNLPNIEETVTPVGPDIFEAPLILSKAKGKKAAKLAPALQSDRNIMAIIGFASGIAGLALLWIVPLVGLLLGIAAIIFSIIGLKGSNMKGFAIAGLALGILNVLLWLVVFLVVAIFLAGI